jgi:hypothetical protein
LRLSGSAVSKRKCPRVVPYFRSFEENGQD